MKNGRVHSAAKTGNGGDKCLEEKDVRSKVGTSDQGDQGNGGGGSCGGGGGGSSGDRLISAGDCRRILVWNVRYGSLLHQINRQPIRVKEMVVTDRLVVTSSPDIPGQAAVIAYW